MKIVFSAGGGQIEAVLRNCDLLLLLSEDWTTDRSTTQIGDDCMFAIHIYTTVERLDTIDRSSKFIIVHQW